MSRKCQLRPMVFSMLLLGALASGGCGDNAAPTSTAVKVTSPTLDTTNEQTFTESLDNIEKTLKPEERKSCRESLEMLMSGGGAGGDYSREEVIHRYAQTKVFSNPKRLADIHGLNCQEIMGKGEVSKIEYIMRKVYLDTKPAILAYKYDPVDDPNKWPGSVADLERFGFSDEVGGIKVLVSFQKKEAENDLAIIITSPDGKRRLTSSFETSYYSLDDIPIE